MPARYGNPIKKQRVHMQEHVREALVLLNAVLLTILLGFVLGASVSGDGERATASTALVAP